MTKRRELSVYNKGIFFLFFIIHFISLLFPVAILLSFLRSTFSLTNMSITINTISFLSILLSIGFTYGAVKIYTHGKDKHLFWGIYSLATVLLLILGFIIANELTRAGL